MVSKRFLSLINLLLAAALVAGAALLARDYYLGLTAPDEETAVAPPAPAPEPPPPPAKEEYAVIVSRNLWAEKFEAPEEAPPPTPPPQREPPPRLRLLGTSVSSDAARSRAFIEDVARRTQEMYRVGDSVSGARVLEIHQNRVVLDNRGESFEIRSFPDSLPVR